MSDDKKARRPQWQRRQIRILQKHLGVNYTTALREWERRREEHNERQDAEGSSVQRHP